LSTPTRIAREVVEPGQPALAALVERFGAEILQADGSLDRTELAARAFVNEETRKELEAITHPAIGEEFLRQVAAGPPDGIVWCTTYPCSWSRSGAFPTTR